MVALSASTFRYLYQKNDVRSLVDGLLKIVDMSKDRPSKSATEDEAKEWRQKKWYVSDRCHGTSL